MLEQPVLDVVATRCVAAGVVRGARCCLLRVRCCCPQCGVGGSQVGVAGAEAGVVGFQAEDPGDAGEVDAVVDQDTNAAEPGDVGVAVPAGATLRAGGFEQALAFVKP